MKSGAHNPSLAVLEVSSVEAPPSSSPGASHSELSGHRSLWTRFAQRPALVGTVLGILSLAFFLAGIGKPAIMYYDEGLYVPEARAFSHWAIDEPTRTHNLARPPFGKMLMAVGIKVAGDTPFGWRVGCAVCGALTLVAVYFWTLLLLGDPRAAALAAVLTLLNNFLFVMSRVGMMDSFLVFFLMWSILAYTAAIALDVSLGRRRLLLACCGLLIGLGAAVKWNAIDTLAVLVLVSVALLWAARRSPDSIPSLSRYARNMQRIGVPSLLLGLFVAPVIFYSLTYWPLCRILGRPFNFAEVLGIHRYMWYLSTHWATNKAITSAWYTWPFSLSPQRALSYLLANPVVAWGGIIALLLCLWRFAKTPALPEGLVLLLFAANFFQWAVTPEKGLVYYYYYPAVMILGVAIAVALRSLPRSIFGVRISLVVVVLAAAVFLWCFPRMTHLQSPWDCALGCWN